MCLQLFNFFSDMLAHVDENGKCLFWNGWGGKGERVLKIFTGSQKIEPKICFKSSRGEGGIPPKHRSKKVSKASVDL